jgi:hypothetical protein
MDNSPPALRSADLENLIRESTHDTFLSTPKSLFTCGCAGSIYNSSPDTLNMHVFFDNDLHQGRLHLRLATEDGGYDLRPDRDGTGCPDADDAVFTERFADQVLDEQSHLARREPIRPQPTIIWRETPIIDATGRRIIGPAE